jgi:hypothetical protein
MFNKDSGAKGSGSGSDNMGMRKPEKVGSFYVLRMILTFLFGLAFLQTLIGITIALITYFFADNKTAWALDDIGEVMTVFIALLIVFGAAHTLLSYSIDKRSVELPERTGKVTRIFTTIYLIFLILGMTGFFVALFVPIVSFLFGTALIEGKDIAMTVAISLSAIIILGVSGLHFTRIFKKLPKIVYPVTIGGLAFVVLVLFAIFPSGEIRRAKVDEKIIDDLYSIESGIESYADKNDRMPESLEDIEIDDLNRDISEYSFEDLGRGSGAGYARFKLCASGFRTDTIINGSSDRRLAMPINDDGTDYFRNHGKGQQCFRREIYVGEGALVGEQPDFEPIVISGTGNHNPDEFDLPIGSYKVEWEYSGNVMADGYGSYPQNFISSVTCSNKLVYTSLVNDIADSGSGSTFLYNYMENTRCFLSLTSVGSRANWEFRIYRID